VALRLGIELLSIAIPILEVEDRKTLAALFLFLFGRSMLLQSQVSTEVAAFGGQTLQLNLMANLSLVDKNLP
jgi:hypothetical protein